MKKIIFAAVAVMAVWMCTSCNSEETYAEQKKRERETVDAFLKRDFVIRAADGTVILDAGKINPIS